MFHAVHRIEAPYSWQISKSIVSRALPSNTFMMTSLHMNVSWFDLCMKISRTFNFLACSFFLIDCSITSSVGFTRRIGITEKVEQSSLDCWLSLQIISFSILYLSVLENASSALVCAGAFLTSLSSRSALMTAYSAATFAST